MDKFISDRNDGTIPMDTIWERYFDIKHPKHKAVVLRFDWIMLHVYGPRFLDVGCSNGLGIYLASQKKSVKELYGIDVCKQAIIKARENNINNHTINLKYGLAENLEYEDNFFDCILMGEILEHVMDDVKAISEAYRVLKTDGTIIITVPNGGHTSADHLRIYTEQTIINLAGNTGFNFIKIELLMEWILLKAIKL
jgi:ubiquinone/menaquinone biosynthesis C-methylase UbiE